jgi:ribosomal protein L17
VSALATDKVAELLPHERIVTQEEMAKTVKVGMIEKQVDRTLRTDVENGNSSS